MTAAPRVGLIWAQAEDRVIGRDGGMPWHVPEDLGHFTEVTDGYPVIMGRATWESISPRYRPLPRRRNIVLTGRQEWSADGAERAGSLDDALALAASAPTEWVWIIGGGAVFDEAMGIADRLEVTELVHPGGFDPEPGDVRAPAIDPEVFALAGEDPPGAGETSRSGIRYRFLRYERLESA
jgi:dihydrofolate reductase